MILTLMLASKPPSPSACADQESFGPLHAGNLTCCSSWMGNTEGHEGVLLNHAGSGREEYARYYGLWVNISNIQVFM